MESQASSWADEFNQRVSQSATEHPLLEQYLGLLILIAMVGLVVYIVRGWIRDANRWVRGDGGRSSVERTPERTPEPESFELTKRQFKLIALAALVLSLVYAPTRYYAQIQGTGFWRSGPWEFIFNLSPLQSVNYPMLALQVAVIVLVLIGAFFVLFGEDKR